MFRKSRKKVFCIGRNKTGTTSLVGFMRSLGYRVGKQASAESLLEDWGLRDFRAIVRHCRGADFFQDIPFSLNYTFQAVDQAYPGSRFILTVRDDAEQWYESLTRFHTQLIDKGRLPTPDDLKAFPYRGKGWLWRAQQLVYGIDEASLYDPDVYKTHYARHRETVESYFRDRPRDLLVLNLAEPDASEKLCNFLGISKVERSMPHLNRSAD